MSEDFDDEHFDDEEKEDFDYEDDDWTKEIDENNESKER
jgi:hypothetical protein